jgi:hypothetical protein
MPSRDAPLRECGGLLVERPAYEPIANLPDDSDPNLPAVANGSQLGLGIAAGKVALIGSYDRTSCLLRAQRGMTLTAISTELNTVGYCVHQTPSARSCASSWKPKPHERTRSRMTAGPGQFEQSGWVN